MPDISIRRGGSITVEAESVQEVSAPASFESGDVQIRKQGVPYPVAGIITADQKTIIGDGTIAHPLEAVAGGAGVVVDNVSIGGDGTEEAPLHTLPDGTAVLTDGVTISGDGTTGNPLIAIATVVKSVSYTATGSEDTNFVVNFAPAMGSANYKVWWAPAGVAAIPSPDFPTGAGNRTVSSFRVLLAAPLNAGDALVFFLTP